MDSNNTEDTARDGYANGSWCLEALIMEHLQTLFIDFHPKKPPTVYDGQKAFQLKRMQRLRKAKAVYMDVLPTNRYDQVLRLVKAGVEFYMLKQTRLIEAYRKNNGIEKSDINDAIILSMIPKEMFRIIIYEKLRMKQALQQYYIVADEIKVLKQKSKTLPEQQQSTVRDAVNTLQRALRTLNRRVLEETGRILPEYQLVSEELGIHGVSLAAVLTYIDFSFGLGKIKSYVGLHDSARKSRSFSRHARRAIQGVALHAPEQSEQYRKLLERYQKYYASNRKARLRLAMAILKDIRRLLNRQKKPQKNP